MLAHWVLRSSLLMSPERQTPRLALGKNTQESVFHPPGHPSGLQLERELTGDFQKVWED